MIQNRQCPDKLNRNSKIKAEFSAFFLLWICCLFWIPLLAGSCRPGAVSPGLQAEAAVRKKTAKRKRKYRISLYKGQKKKLSKKGLKGRVRWKSSNKKIIRVTKSGRVYARRKGKARVYASARGRKICYIITVKRKKKKGGTAGNGRIQETPSKSTERNSGTELAGGSGEIKAAVPASGVCSHAFEAVSRQICRTVTDSPAWEEVRDSGQLYVEECGCGRQFPVYFIRDKEKTDIQAADLAAKEAHARHCEEECAPFERELARLTEAGMTNTEDYCRTFEDWQSVFDLHSSYQGRVINGEPETIHHAAVTHTETETQIIGYRCIKCGNWKKGSDL